MLAGQVQVATFPFGPDHTTATWGLIARAEGVTKASATQRIAEHHGLDLTEVVVVGDWLNDVPMMRVAGRSFAMAQSPEAVRAAATDLLEADSRVGGGLLEAARRSGLL